MTWPVMTTVVETRRLQLKRLRARTVTIKRLPLRRKHRLTRRTPQRAPRKPSPPMPRALTVNLLRNPATPRALENPQNPLIRALERAPASLATRALERVPRDRRIPRDRKTARDPKTRRDLRDSRPRVGALLMALVLSD